MFIKLKKTLPCAATEIKTVRMRLKMEAHEVRVKKNLHATQYKQHLVNTPRGPRRLPPPAIGNQFQQSTDLRPNRSNQIKAKFLHVIEVKSLRYSIAWGGRGGVERVVMRSSLETI